MISIILLSRYLLYSMTDTTCVPKNMLNHKSDHCGGNDVVMATEPASVRDANKHMHAQDHLRQFSISQDAQTFISLLLTTVGQKTAPMFVHFGKIGIV